MTYGFYSATYSVDRVGFVKVELLATACIQVEVVLQQCLCGTPEAKQECFGAYKEETQTLADRISHDGCAKTILHNSGHRKRLMV